MSMYLVYIMCALNFVPFMGWNWTTYEFLTHVYYFRLWDNKYKKHFVDICDNLMSPLHFLIFNKIYSRLTNVEKEEINPTGYWYIEEQYIYFRIYGLFKAPHLSPKFLRHCISNNNVWHQYVFGENTKKVMPLLPI